MKPAPHARYMPKLFQGSSHSWALQAVSALPTTTTVLDIGPGSGVIGRSLRERGWQELYAVEIDAETRRQVAPFYKKVEPALESYNTLRFDLIFLLDVIEHVPNPEVFLKQAAQLLTPQGIMLVSVPNVAHWSVRCMLLGGFFEYSERGILDRTHLTFFTRRRFRALLEKLDDCRITSLSASITPLELVLPTKIWDNKLYSCLSRLRLALARLWPGLFAYQHLAELKRLD